MIFLLKFVSLSTFTFEVQNKASVSEIANLFLDKQKWLRIFVASILTLGWLFTQLERGNSSRSGLVLGIQSLAFLVAFSISLMMTTLVVNKFPEVLAPTLANTSSPVASHLRKGQSRKSNQIKSYQTN